MQLVQRLLCALLCRYMPGKAVFQHLRRQLSSLLRRLARSHTVEHNGHLHSRSLQNAAGHRRAHHLVLHVCQTAKAQKAEAALTHQLLHQSCALLQRVLLRLRGNNQRHTAAAGFCCQHIHRPFGINNFPSLLRLRDRAPHEQVTLGIIKVLLLINAQNAAVARGHLLQLR